jgi:hypothetical protein
MMGANQKWVVPATGDERRFSVNEVSDARRQDKDYFIALYAELNNGGLICKSGAVYLLIGPGAERTSTPDAILSEDAFTPGTFLKMTCQPPFGAAAGDIGHQSGRMLEHPTATCHITGRGASSAQLANSPASERVADSPAGGHYARSYHHWRWYSHARRHYSATVVHAAVVAIATAAAIWAAVKTGSTASGDRNCQTSLGSIERGERHGLGGGKGKETDADGDSGCEKLRHSFLLSCCVM